MPFPSCKQVPNSNNPIDLRIVERTITFKSIIHLSNMLIGTILLLAHERWTNQL